MECLHLVQGNDPDRKHGSRFQLPLEVYKLSQRSTRDIFHNFLAEDFLTLQYQQEDQQHLHKDEPKIKIVKFKYFKKFLKFLIFEILKFLKF
jgi:hypothetical protein